MKKQISTTGQLAVIEQKIDNLTGWIKSLDEKVGKQNGRIGKSEQEIAIIKHTIQDIHTDFKGFEENEEKRNSKIDEWSRTKLITWLGIGATLGFFVLNLLWEMIQSKLFGG